MIIVHYHASNAGYKRIFALNGRRTVSHPNLDPLNNSGTQFLQQKFISPRGLNYRFKAWSPPPHSAD